MLAMKNIVDKQQLTAKYFQSIQPPRLFEKGDQVLWCPRDPKIRKSKFDSIWHGPYRVQLVLPNNTVLLINADNYDAQATIVNSTKLKHYHAAETHTKPVLSLGDIHKDLAAEANRLQQEEEASIDAKDTNEKQALEKQGESMAPMVPMEPMEVHVSHIHAVQST